MTLSTAPDLFRRCRERETGHWRVGGESTSRTVHLDSGDIVFASSNFPEDRLTSILVERGKLTQSQMDHALANLKPGVSVGKNLIEMGFITQRDLLDVARIQVERIVWSALVAPEAPTFEKRDELEENIVRLPIDTPSLLFRGIMKISDKEILLELLGPLNQVVLLQGKRVFELDLPPDLAKMAPLMDGTHTILELSSEAAVEPMRTGAFALFLREMGWGKLYELPPLDRQALDRALTTDLTKPPASIPSPRSILFTTIEEAAKPTTNLEHLSKMLDDIANHEDSGDQPEPLYNGLEGTAQEAGPEPHRPAPLKPGLEPPKPIGRVLPLPSEPLEDPQPPQEPPIVISHDDADEDTGKEPRKEPRKAPKAKQNRSRRGGLIRNILWVLILLAFVSVAAYSIWNLKTRPTDPPFTLTPTDLRPSGAETTPPGTTQVEPTETGQEPVAPQTQPQTQPQPSATTNNPVANTPPQTTQPQATPTQPAQPPANTRTVDTSIEARFRAIADGDANRALEQGAAFQASLPGSVWTIRLVVACQSGTLQGCASALASARPDLFLLPIRLSNGNSCYQLFLGRFSNKNAAEAEARKLPDHFKNATPKVMQINEIVKVQ